MKKVIAAFALATAMSSSNAQVPEIADPNIPDIAITTMLNGAPVILWNPMVCGQMGMYVCRFFRAHEYGHVMLGHLIMGTFPQQAEFEADCYAAQNAQKIEVQAALQHFFNNGFMGNWSHGTGYDRATRILNCAQSRFDWP